MFLYVSDVLFIKAESKFCSIIWLFWTFFHLLGYYKYVKIEILFRVVPLAGLRLILIIDCVDASGRWNGFNWLCISHLYFNITLILEDQIDILILLIVLIFTKLKPANWVIVEFRIDAYCVLLSEFEVYVGSWIAAMFKLVRARQLLPPIVGRT